MLINRSRRRRAGYGTLAVLAGIVPAACSNTSKADTATTAAPTTARPATTTSSTSTTTTTTLPPITTTTTTEAPTTTAPPPVPVYPLLGVPLPDPSMPVGPALVVKIDNAPGARPQTGFNAADIVVEEVVNDHLSRFAMIFNSRGSNPVGPIRSGRLQDIDLFGFLNHPLFAWSGGNRTVTNAIDASDLVDLGPNRAGGYFRTGRAKPHNLYNTTDALFAQAPPESGPPAPMFEYRSGEPLPGEPAAGLDLSLDAVNVNWRWDPATEAYLRTMEGRPHIDAGDGQQVWTNNVVVLVMEYNPGISGSPDAVSLGWNEAFVLTGGNVVHGVWARDDRLNGFALADDNGKPIRLTPGRTFVELPREGFTTVVP